MKLQKILTPAAVLLFLLAFLEVGMQTFWMGKIGVYAQPVLYMGMAGGYLFLMWFFSVYGKVKTERTFESRSYQWAELVVILGVVVLVVLSALEYRTILDKYPISPLNSDILPALQMYVERLLAGTWVYAPMEFPGWTVIPNYLPLVYLPYVIPELLGIDYRWLPLGLFIFLGLISIVVTLRHKSSSPWEYAFNALLPFILLYHMIEHEPTIFGHTVELMIVCYYLILARSVMSPKLWWAALGILLCFMSRYSFGLWLPFYGVIFALTYGWPKAFKMAGWVIAGVMVVYIIPFVFQDPMVYFKGMSYYDFSARGEWVPQGWQEEGARPYHLGRGMGFAVYVYDFVEGDVPAKIKVIQKWNAITSILITLILFAIYWFNRKRIVHLKLFLIFGLKIYLMVFYSFIHVPYAYLHLLPLMLIIPIFHQLDISGMIKQARQPVS